MTKELSDPKQLLKRLREGQIWDLTESQAQAWLKMAKSIWSEAIQDQILSMRWHSLIAELADRRGWWYTSEPMALDDCFLQGIRERFYEQQKLLRSEPSDQRVNFKWFRQAGWLLLQDARREHRSERKGTSTEKHRNAAVQALESTQRLQTHLSRILPAAGCHELLYRVAFSIARHLQVLERYEDAEKELIKALDHCHQLRHEIRERLSKLDEYRHKQWFDDPEREENQLTIALLDNFTVFNTTVVVANLGRIDVERGNLTQALPQLAIARTLLLGSKDLVMQGFVDLQLGTVYRQLNSSIHTDIPDSEQLIRSAIAKFQDANHQPLLAKGRLELAQYYFGKPSRSATDLAEARALLEQDGVIDGIRQRWEAQRRLLLARIEFAEGTSKSRREATKNAEYALKIAHKAGLKEVETVANLVLADVALEDGDYKEALRGAREAERLKPKNVADRAWLYLVFADAWKLEGSLKIAQRFLDQWRTMANYVENETIRKRAALLQRSMEDERQKGFFISPDDNDIDVTRRTEKLKEFLISRARSMAQTIPEQAELLGVQPQTLANWRSMKNKAKGSARSEKAP
jgi:tetratricopeptide (TPR) repeat protein